MLRACFRGANKEKRDKDGLTPLLSAAYCGSKDGIAMLLQNDVKAGAVDKDEKTAMHLATDENSDESLSLLLENAVAKKFIDRPDRSLNSPVHVAAYYGYIGCFKVTSDALLFRRLIFNANLDVFFKDSNRRRSEAGLQK